MNNSKKAEEILFKHSDIDLDAAADSLKLLTQRHPDFGDLFFERVASESFVLEEGIIKGGSFDISQGVGVRAVQGGRTGFAYSDVLDVRSLKEACEAARSISQKQGQAVCVRANCADTKALYTAEDPLLELRREDKIRALQDLNALVREKDQRVTQVIASLSCAYRTVLIMDTSGKVSCDLKPMVHIGVSAILEENGHREDGFGAAGGAFLPSRILTESCLSEIAAEAVRAAAVNLRAKNAPAGAMTVVLGHGWPGVLVHEAVGHGLEGDFNRTGSSAFTGLIGKQVASDKVTVIDDGTLPERRGSLSFDDEGTKTRRNVLIENGVLKGYMQDRQNAMLMGMEPTGNGRRESYNCLPMPRMTNTFMLPGTATRDEIIGSVDNGIYAVNFKGGQVDITSGKFVFSASEAYEIRHGKVGDPIRGATLIGNGPDTMKKVSMVGNDLEFDHGIGTCGKAGQSVPVGIGIPTLKIDSITVGGTGQSD